VQTIKDKVDVGDLEIPPYGELKCRRVKSDPGKYILKLGRAAAL
jgi:hypothetical protein